MLSALVAQGISPLVVSNLPLTDTDRATLAATAFRVIERPNIGYDFGGYRDGILSIAPLLPDLRCLWVLNDSAWLVDPSGQWFAQARASNTDFTGCVSNYGIRKVDIKDHGRIIWQHSFKDPRFHYSSNTWRIGSNILQSNGFLRFWKRLQIRDSKYLTVRRGEIGFSRWVIQNGYSHKATHQVINLENELTHLADDSLDAVTRHLVIMHPQYQAEKMAVLAQDKTSAEGRRNRLTLCLAATSRYGAIVAIPYYLLKHAELPFVKKSLFTTSAETVRIGLDIATEIQGVMGPVILAEGQGLAAHKNLIRDQ